MLTAVQVIRHLKMDRRTYYDQRMKSYSKAGDSALHCFQIALGWKNLTGTDVTRLTTESNRPPSEQLLRLVNLEAAHRAQLTKLFGFDIRSCADYDDVDGKIGWNSELSSQNVYIDLPAGDHSLEPCKEERRAARLLIERLVEGKRSFFYEPSDFEIGFLSFTACLAQEQEFERYYKRIVYLLDEDDRFAGAINKLASELGVAALSGKVDEFIEAAREKNVLIVLAECNGLGNVRELKAQSPFILALISRLLQLDQMEKWSGPAIILGTGQNEWLEKRVTQSALVSEIVNKLGLTNPREGLQQLLYSQWKRFCHLRGVSPHADIGSRLKRTQWHYAGVAKLPVYPINVRTRVLFASNLENQSYFDPTLGYRKLAGFQIEDLPIDMRLFHYATTRQIDALKKGAPGRRSLSAIRYVSTAGYWLTHEGLEELAKVFKAPDQTDDEKPAVPSLDLNSILPQGTPFATRVRHLSPRGEIDAEIRSIEHRYVMSLAVKAIVQDDWRESNPMHRAVAEYRVAQRLERYRNELHRQPGWLSKEFPFEPSWGREDIFLVAETIRHLIRSMGSYPDKAGIENTEIPEHVGEPRADLMGTSPSEVVDFCYASLYRKELNRTTGKQQSKRIITNHGAYVLAKELLQLMGDYTRPFGHPHPNLHPSLRNSFIRDSGYVALGVGDLDVAVDCFSRLVENYSDQGDNRQKLNARLSLVLALGSAFKTKKAHEQLDIAEREFNAIAGGASDRNPLKRRLESRKAVLTYADKGASNPDVLASFQAIDRISPIEEAELLRVFLIVMEAEGENHPDPSADPFSRCLTAALTASAEDRHHDAMGLKILLARFLRHKNLVSAAEALLDQVYLDLREQGAAERTALRFLVEAGRTLINKAELTTDPSDRAHFLHRAYSVYLLRCLRRSEARGFMREAMAAKRSSIQALGELKAVTTGWTPERWKAFTTDQKRRHDAFLEREPLPLQGHSYSDPLWGFSIREEFGIGIGPISASDIEKKLAELDHTAS